jgi:hypothetical protein
MAILTTDLDFESIDVSLDELRHSREGLTIVEYCSMMTRKLGLLASGVPQALPEPVPFELPPYVAG